MINKTTHPNPNHASPAPQAENGLALAPASPRGLQLSSLEDLTRFAQIVVKSGLAPKAFQTAEQVVLALVAGAELGISAMQSLQGMTVIGGNLGIKGDLALALCSAHPSYVDHTEEESGEGDGLGCTVTVQRRGRTPVVGAFTVRDAKTAKLWGKAGPWTDYPRRMLRYRALGFALRDAFADVLKGIKTAEELQDYPETPAGFEHAKPARVIPPAPPAPAPQATAPSPRPMPERRPVRRGQATGPLAPPARKEEPLAPVTVWQGTLEAVEPKVHVGAGGSTSYYDLRLDGGRTASTTDAFLMNQATRRVGTAVDLKVRPGKTDGTWRALGLIPIDDGQEDPTLDAREVETEEMPS